MSSLDLVRNRWQDETGVLPFLRAVYLSPKVFFLKMGILDLCGDEKGHEFARIALL